MLTYCSSEVAAKEHWSILEDWTYSLTWGLFDEISLVIDLECRSLSSEYIIGA